MSSLGNKRVDLFDMGAGASDPTADDNVQVASGEIRTIFVSADEQFCCVILENKSYQHVDVSCICFY